jgi:hypothetical protein
MTPTQCSTPGVDVSTRWDGRRTTPQGDGGIKKGHRPAILVTL